MSRFVLLIFRFDYEGFEVVGQPEHVRALPWLAATVWALGGEAKDFAEGPQGCLEPAGARVRSDQWAQQRVNVRRVRCRFPVLVDLAQNHRGLIVRRSGRWDVGIFLD